MWATPNAGSCRSYLQSSIYVPQLFSAPGPSVSKMQRLAHKPGAHCCASSLIPSTWQHPAPTLNAITARNVASSSPVVHLHCNSTLSTRLPGERLHLSAPRINPATNRHSSTCSAAESSRPNATAEEDHYQHRHAQLSVPVVGKQLDQLSQRVSQELGMSVHFRTLDQNIRTDCPFCRGGSRTDASDRNSLSIRVVEDGHAVLYHCFRATCGKSGRVDLTGRHSSRSRRSEIPHSLEEPYGQMMLQFFEERGIGREVLEACGVYSALVKPPVLLESEQEDAEMGKGIPQGSTAASSGGSEGQEALVHCAVMPYRDSNGKEVSRTYMYLDAVALEEEVHGRTPIQLRSPPGYEGPRLGEPIVDLQAEATKSWVASVGQQQQQVAELQTEAADEGISSAGYHHQQQIDEFQTEPAESGVSSGGQQQQAELVGHTQGEVEQQRWQQGAVEGGYEGEQQQQQQQHRQQVDEGAEFENGHHDHDQQQPPQQQPLQQRGLHEPNVWQHQTPGSRRHSSSSSSSSSMQAGNHSVSRHNTKSPSPPPSQPTVSEVCADEALPREAPPASAREYFVQYFRDLSHENQRNNDFLRQKANMQVANVLAQHEEEITLENVRELRDKPHIGRGSINKMIDLLQKWQPPASPGAQDSAAAAAAAAAKEQGGQGLHQTATGGVGRRGKIEAKPGTRHASRQQESPGLTRGLSTSVSSFEPPLAPERSSKLRRSRSASASPGAADSADMAFTYVEPPVPAAVPENQIVVDHFTLLVSLLVNEELHKKADAYRKDLHTVAAHSESVTQDAAALRGMNISKQSKKAIGRLFDPGPNAALLSLLEVKNIKVPPDLQNYPKKITLEKHILREVASQCGGVGPTTLSNIRQILEIQQRFEAVASRPQPTPTPSALDALTPQRLRGQEETSPQQSLQGDGVSDAGVAEADKGEDGSDGGESVAKGKVYKARSASSREPVSGVHDSSAAATTAAGLHSPDAAASDKGVGGEEERVASRARAAEHLLAGLPSVWSTEAGPKRTLWGVHDVVSFLAKEEEALTTGQVQEEECIEGSGKGNAPLYLYLVEDELDRLSLIMLGLPPNAVLCLPPNLRRDFQGLCEEQQRQKREAVMLPRTSDLISEEQPEAHIRSTSRRGSTAAGQAQRGSKLTGERSVLSCVTSVAESVFGDKCGRVYLALRNGPLVPGGRDDGELEDALAGVLGKERCARIRWPISLEDLPFSSPHSPDHDNSSDANSEPSSSSPSPPPYSSTNGLGDSLSSTASTSPTMPAALSFPHGTGYGSATGPAFSAKQAALPLRLSANEVLVADGLSTLLYVVQYQVKDWPVEGLYEMKDFAETILQDYHDRRGFSQGVSTGWPYLDQFYKVVPGELTILTGVPNSGKSEWLDALCMNLAKQHGWAFAMASFEKSPKGHARNLLEKYAEKPFMKDQVDLDADGREVPQEQMSEEELRAGMEFLDSHFLLIRHAVEDKVPIVERSPDAGPGLVESAQGLQEASPTIDWVLSKADAAVKRYNIRGLVIDPYNELDHSCPFERATEYVSQMLSKVKRFAQRSGVHVWFVAHPRQLPDYSSHRPPTLYDISGSAHFYNKADAGIVVHRHSSTEEGGPDPIFNPVRIYVRKMRNKAAGIQGECVLFYKRSTGTYYEPYPEEQEMWS